MSSHSIQILLEEKVIKTLPLGEKPLLIGRMPENDLIIDHRAVSRSHAKIFRENNSIILEDQDSENGTVVNGLRIRRMSITPEDQIQIGNHRLQLLSHQKHEDHAIDQESADSDQDSIKGPLHEQNPTLTLKFQDSIEQILPWNQPTLNIGRSFKCDIVLDRPSVSRRHAILEFKNNQFEIQDLDTGSGTFVNGTKIKKGMLNNGDVIQIGGYDIIFHIGVHTLENLHDSPSETPTEENILPISDNEIELETVLDSPEHFPENIIVSAKDLEFHPSSFISQTPATAIDLKETGEAENEISGKISLDADFVSPANPTDALRLEVKIDFSHLPPELSQPLIQWLESGGKLPVEVSLPKKNQKK